MKHPIVIIAVNCQTTNILYHYVKDIFHVDQIFIEKPVSRYKIIKGRIRIMGMLSTIGQLFFRILIFPLLKCTSGKRVKEIVKDYNLNDNKIDINKIKYIDTINSEKVVQMINALNPKVVVINGTRVIEQEIIDSISCEVINLHVGITPQYRGVHGAYWALANHCEDKCGVTIHLVDKGIDTGNILKQQAIKPTKRDNFTTYPLLQYGEGLPLLVDAINELIMGKKQFITPENDTSKLWFHPTFFEYIINRIKYNVK